ncbi:protein CHAPERONE-LIKE PROTEIN OF POR1, chloroplastic [Quercus robur]|uniref:protein CHAPERONE-LIKE PROTEIN OF POR1, chloroplastic n=1 Tax=Quercus robur TaxID=38942 RepID=UPI0021632D98|nr:protein CHAPERONE-LIKE PROTEIN OF POR1, chloroplastic [Quercus robur]
MDATLSVRPNRFTSGSPYPRPTSRKPGPPPHISRRRHTTTTTTTKRNQPWPWPGPFSSARRAFIAAPPVLQAGSRADDSAPFEMSVENALKLLGVSDGASFDDILRAKTSVLASCKDDQDAIAQVEAAYDMLLMRSLTQRRAGKVVNSSIRYADVKPVNASGIGSMPQWLQTTVKNSPISVDTPSTGDLGIQAGVYGALMVLTYVNGASTSSSLPYSGADVPGLILAGSFGASLYFMTKKNVKLGKATVITLGGLVAGAVVGSAVESWLQVDIVPFLGVHSPAAVISEFILFSQLLVSLYLR